MTNLPALRFSPITLASLAREIATGINELPTVLQHFQISQQEYEMLLQNNSFQAILASAKAEWEGAVNAEKRIQVQSQAGIEDVLPTVVARMGDKNEPLNHVIEAGKWLKSLAKIGDEGKSAQGEKFVININLGGDEEKHVVDITPVHVDEVSAVQPIPQGEAPQPALQHIPEGPSPSS